MVIIFFFFGNPQLISFTPDEFIFHVSVSFFFQAKEGWTRVPSLKDRWRLKPRSSSQSSDKPLLNNPKVEGGDDDFHSTCVGGRVTNWATDFEKLLNDPVGLRTFTVRPH